MALEIIVKQFMSRDYDLIYILPEFEVVGMSRPEYNNAALRFMGLPPTVKFLETNSVALYDSNDKPLDTYYLLREHFAAQCPSSWLDAYITQKLRGYLSDGTCYTDNTGGKAWNQIVTCGNVLHPTGKTKQTAGELYHEVEQLQADTMMMMMEKLAQYPHLKTWSTISRRENKGKRVIPFDHCGGNDVPALLYCKTETNYIKDARVRYLERDEPIPVLYHE